MSGSYPRGPPQPPSPPVTGSVRGGRVTRTVVLVTVRHHRQLFEAVGVVDLRGLAREGRGVLGVGPVGIRVERGQLLQEVRLRDLPGGVETCCGHDFLLSWSCPRHHDDVAPPPPHDGAATTRPDVLPLIQNGPGATTNL